MAEEKNDEAPETAAAAEEPTSPVEEPVAAEETPAAEEPAPAEETPAAEEPAPAEEPAASEEPVAAEEAATEEAVAAQETAASEEAVPAEEPVAAEETAPAEEPAAVEEPAAEPVRTLVELAADARYSATGKRKSAVARVILLPGSGAFLLNGKPLDSYFPRRTLQEVVRQPLEVTGYLDRVDIRARIHGGGISSQADAVRHGIAKALIEADPNLRGDLKRRQLLTRDPRVKERRKAGLKKARKRPQFSKR
jgi:small subunit ribosomal protein S9